MSIVCPEGEIALVVVLGCTLEEHPNFYTHRHCQNCERCTWNPGSNCGRPDHDTCMFCGHCTGRHVPAWYAKEQGWEVWVDECKARQLAERTAWTMSLSGREVPESWVEEQVALLTSPEFDRQTAVMDALPHAATIGKLENWRMAADEFMRVLEAFGYEVVAKSEPSAPVEATLRG